MDINKLDNLIREYYEMMVKNTRLYVELSKKSGISYLQMIILYHLEYSEILTQKDICNDLYLSKQTVNSILSNWKDEGIIDFKFLDGNNKTKYIFFTEKGNEYSKKTLSLVHKVERNVMKKMGNTNGKMMIDTTNSYLKYLEQEVKENE